MHSCFLSKYIPLSVLVVVVWLVGGCGETAKPPTPISLDQIPTELGKAFASAKAETKELSDLAVNAVQSKEFPKASMTLTALAQRPDLTKVQSGIVAGAAMTINALLLEAESKGDPQAVETLNLRRMTK